MVHHSKVDQWLAVVMVLGGLLPLLLGVLMPLLANEEDGPVWLPLGLGIVIDAGLLAILYPLRYEIGPENLLIRSGVLRWQVPLDAIQEIRPTRNPLSSPALSLDRLEVRYGAKRSLSFILISPKDKAAFLADMVRVTPGLVRQGDSVVRAT